MYGTHDTRLSTIAEPCRSCRPWAIARTLPMPSPPSTRSSSPQAHVSPTLQVLQCVAADPHRRALAGASTTGGRAPAVQDHSPRSQVSIAHGAARRTCVIVLIWCTAHHGTRARVRPRKDDEGASQVASWCTLIPLPPLLIVFPAHNLVSSPPRPAVVGACRSWIRRSSTVTWRREYTTRTRSCASCQLGTVAVRVLLVRPSRRAGPYTARARARDARHMHEDHHAPPRSQRAVTVCVRNSRVRPRS
ncbi:hypothetical protein OH77DRAFT_947991 [Trametes cingulata]|nr:hypothetical protein OH77DRAFT_947991 [Trametes cingulata]